MSVVHWAVLLVAAQRVLELAYANRNTKRLLAAGGVEWGRGHYPLIVALHAAWLASLALIVPANAPVSWTLIGVFLVLQAARLWTISTLGPYWTTRVIRVPGSPQIRRGPYRFLRHPNYVVVALEIAILPAAFGAWWIAGIFSVANAVLLAHRIKVEESALKG